MLRFLPSIPFLIKSKSRENFLTWSLEQGMNKWTWCFLLCQKIRKLPKIIRALSYGHSWSDTREDSRVGSTRNSRPRLQNLPDVITWEQWGLLNACDFQGSWERYTAVNYSQFQLLGSRWLSPNILVPIPGRCAHISGAACLSLWVSEWAMKTLGSKSWIICVLIPNCCFWSCADRGGEPLLPLPL